MHTRIQAAPVMAAATLAARSALASQPGQQAKLQPMQAPAQTAPGQGLRLPTSHALIASIALMAAHPAC